MARCIAKTEALRPSDLGYYTERPVQRLTTEGFNDGPFTMIKLNLAALGGGRPGTPRVGLTLGVTLALMLIFASDAYAYADPGSGTLLWQLVMAGFVGLMFYVHKISAWIKEKMKSRPPTTRH